MNYLFDEIYQTLFFASIFFILRILAITFWKFQSFRKAVAIEDNETAKTIVFTLTREDKHLLLVSVGIIIAYLL